MDRDLPPEWRSAIEAWGAQNKPGADVVRALYARAAARAALRRAAGGPATVHGPVTAVDRREPVCGGDAADP